MTPALFARLLTHITTARWHTDEAWAAHVPTRWTPSLHGEAWYTREGLLAARLIHHEQGALHTRHAWSPTCTPDAHTAWRLTARLLATQHDTTLIETLTLQAPPSCAERPDAAVQQLLHAPPHTAPALHAWLEAGATILTTRIGETPGVVLCTIRWTP